MVSSLVDVEWDVSGLGIGHVLPIRQVESDIEEVESFFVGLDCYPQVPSAFAQPADSTPARLKLANFLGQALAKKLGLEIWQLTGIIFLISRRIIRFFHI